MYSTKLLVPFFKQFRPDLVVECWSHTRTCGGCRLFRSSFLSAS